MTIHETLAQAIFDRVNCRNIGGWLEQLATSLHLDPTALMPAPPVASHLVDIPEHGLSLTLTHPHAGDVEVGDPDRWVIHTARFTLPNGHDPGWKWPLPFRLDAANETPDTATDKLGDENVGLRKRDLEAGDYRQSFFMENALVLEILWRPELRGIARITIVGLGSERLEPPVDDPDRQTAA